MDIVVSKKEVAGIPLLELSGADGAKRPLVVMVHGYGGRKDFMLNQAYFLASQGFTVAVPDAWGHGERGEGGIPNFFEAVCKTADDVGTLLDYYSAQPQADAGRAGIAGYSMGGCVVYEYIARPGRRVKAAVPFIATPDWVALMEQPATAQLFREYGLVPAAEGMAPFVAAAREVQPLNRMASIAGLPLLMLNGSDDPLMPACAQQRFHDRLLPLYEKGEDLRLVIAPGVGHADNAPMNVEMAMWFIRYL